MGNTPSEPGQPTSPKRQSPAKLERWTRMHRRDHPRPFGALEEPCAICDCDVEPVYSCQTPEREPTRPVLFMSILEDRAAAESPDSKTEAPSRTPEQNG